MSKGQVDSFTHHTPKECIGWMEKKNALSISLHITYLALSAACSPVHYKKIMYEMKCTNGNEWSVYFLFAMRSPSHFIGSGINALSRHNANFLCNFRNTQKCDDDNNA